MNPFFADTFYWIALANRRDSAHQVVMNFTSSLAPRMVVTSDEVLTEFLAYCASDDMLREKAGREVTKLIRHPDIRVIPQTRNSFLDGLALYNARPDKGYSLTDCISMQAMRREGLAVALTNDRHFEQEGFRALFPHGEISSMRSSLSAFNKRLCLPRGLNIQKLEIQATEH